MHAHKDTDFCSGSQWAVCGFGSALSYLQDVCCTWHLSWLRGHELHAKAIEAFYAKGFGPPVSASSQVFSR